MSREEIITGNPIVDFVRSRGHELKSAGQNFVTNACPQTQHKRGHRPVMIYPETQSWSCHDCKRGGSVIDWMMIEQNMTAADAMRILGGGNSSSPELVATYDYIESGNLLYQTCRYQPKDFRQRRPDGKAGWIWNLEDVRRVLYRLPELLDALERGLPIILVEGEKDVDALMKLGFPTAVTCNPMGAGKWRDEYSETLRGASVYVIADKDEAGRTHAQQVAASLYGMAARVSVVELSDRDGHSVKDASDWLAAGGNVGELAELLDNAPEWAAESIELPETDTSDSLRSESSPRGLFPLDALNPVMRAIAEQSAEVYQIKPELPGMAAVAVLAGAIGKAFVVNGAVSGRETHCNIYVIPGAPKSYGKNAAATVAAPLSVASNEMAKCFRETERPKLLTEKKVSEKREKMFVTDCAAADAIDSERDEMQRELAQIQKRLDEIESLLKWPPTCLLGNATSAALTEILKRNGETIFSFSPEAGELVRIALGKFTKDRAADFDLFLSGYTVESARETRISRGDSGDFVPCISVLWFCQPFLLRELFTNEEALERGLTARVLPFIVEHESEIPEDDGVVRNVSNVARQDWDSLVRRVLGCRDSVQTIMCSPEAREVFRAFHNEAVRLRNGKYRAIEGELGRWRENAIRIAGGQCVADAISEGQDLEWLTLTAEQAERGVKIARWSHLHSLAMLNKGLADRQSQRVETLQALLSRYGGAVTLRDLRDRHGFAPYEVKMLAAEYPSALSIQTNKPANGRPSEILTIPKL